MYPVLQLGPLSLPLPELTIILGFWGGSALMVKANSARFKDTGVLEKILWTSLIAGIIGARLSFFARNPEAFSGDYLSLISLNYHLFDPGGGLIIGIGTGLAMTYRLKVEILKIVDGLVPFVSLFTLAVHLSFFFSGSSFGIPTGLPWGIYLWGAQRHPVQIYYILSGLLVLFIILYYLPRYAYAQGLYITTFILLTNLYMLFISRFQSVSKAIFSGIRLDQVLYWTGLLFGLIFFFKLFSHSNILNSYESKR